MMGVGVGLGKHFENRGNSVYQRSMCKHSLGRAEHQAVEAIAGLDGFYKVP